MSNYKKTLVGAAVSGAILAFSGAAVADTNLEAKYEQGIYGLIAMQVANRDYDNSPANDGVQFNNESRLGWRGTAKFDSLEDWTFCGKSSLVTSMSLLLAKMGAMAT